MRHGTFRLILLVCGVAAWSAAAGADTADWARRLAAVPPGTYLQVDLADGFRGDGFLVGADADSLRLAPTAGAAHHAFALADLVAVRREVSHAGRGWVRGEQVGAVLGALSGLLLAAVVDGVGEVAADDVRGFTYAGAAVGCATAGAVTCGAVGAFLGLSGSRWQDLPPLRPAVGRRLVLHAGIAGADGLAGFDYQGLHLRAWLPRRLGGWLDLGPEAGWSHLGGAQSAWTGEHADIGDTWWVGLQARLTPAAPGLQPFGSAGLGWYGREDTYLGTSLGMGLRWHGTDGGGPECELRWHGRSTGIDDVPDNSQVTVTAGWSVPF